MTPTDETETNVEPELDRVAMAALQALAALIEEHARPDDDVRATFAFVDGRAFLLDVAARPVLQEATAGNDAPLEVLCNGAGLVGLLQDNLDGRMGQVFLARGEREVLERLAAVIERKRQSALDVRTARATTKATNKKRG